MDLKSAIKIAVRFVEQTPKHETILSYVRFIPGTSAYPAMVSAQNGWCGVILYLDPPYTVPNTLLPVDILKQILKEASTGMSMSEVPGGIEVKVGRGTYGITQNKVPPLDQYPGIPAVPMAMEMVAFDGQAVGQVLHAAGKTGSAQCLQAVHFTPGLVEATDKYRIAQADMLGKWEGLLPVEMFQRMGKLPYKAVFQPQMAFLRYEEEVRFGKYFIMPYPNTQASIPPITDTAVESIVDVASMLKAVKQAQGISEIGSICIRFEPQRVVVSAWKKDECPEIFISTLGAKSIGSGQILLSGKHMVEALKVITTPCVQLWHDQPLEPLRLRSAGFTEYIWPQLAEKD